MAWLRCVRLAHTSRRREAVDGVAEGLAADGAEGLGDGRAYSAMGTGIRTSRNPATLAWRAGI